MELVVLWVSPNLTRAYRARDFVDAHPRHDPQLFKARLGGRNPPDTIFLMGQFCWILERVNLGAELAPLAAHLVQA